MKITVNRKGKEQTFTVELKNDVGNTEIQRGSDNVRSLGASFTEISDAKKRQLGISSGVEVTSVESNGLFRKEGINKGFIIMRMNNTPVNSESDVTKIVSSILSRNSQDKVLLVAGFYPNGRTQYIAIDLSQQRQR